MEIKDYGVIELADKIAKKELTSKEVVQYFIGRMEQGKKYNAVLEIFYDALVKAEQIDKRIANGEKVGRLAGVPIVIKDNILYEGKIASCASKFLENHVAQYTSTVVNKLLGEGAVIIGRTNMDEFAMGGSTENSAFGVCHNAVDFECVPGGSSGGSAVSVAGGFAPCALGSDTGGSVRQPSSYNGVVGMKPTFGRVSRYGVVAFASSLDQVGPITKNVKDNALLLNILAGHDENDETSLTEEVDDYIKNMTGSIQGLKVGVCKQVKSMMKNNSVFENIEKWVQSQGATITEIEIPNIELCLPAYYIIAPAEATSNLGRFDGIKYSKRSEKAKNVDEIYVKSRSEGFGKEVQRRIMLGNFVLSSGFYDAYYNKAKKLQQKIRKEFLKAFEDCDVLLIPTTMGEAYKLGAITNPVEMYMEDIFTIPISISGIPAMSIPCGKGPNNRPLGVQVCAKHLNESAIYNFADYFEQHFEKESK